jgi:hypothetical protein
MTFKGALKLFDNFKKLLAIQIRAAICGFKE